MKLINFRLVRTMACSQSSLGKAKCCKFQSFINTVTPKTLSEQSEVMDSSKQLPSTLKIKIIDAQKAGEGYKQTEKHFQEAVSSVGNVIKKWQ